MINLRESLSYASVSITAERCVYSSAGTITPIRASGIPEVNVDGSVTERFNASRRLPLPLQAACLTTSRKEGTGRIGTQHESYVANITS